MVKIKTHL